MLCPLPKTSVNVARYPKFTEHLAWAVDYKREGARLQEYDEFWPVRWSRHFVYGAKEGAVASSLPGPDSSDELYDKWRPPPLLISLPVIGTVRFS
ncbi:unnamed protein product [Strongylus vulgaris]|uniref:Uncharacterized protein n=1 Tax=Strongylus vulgaris TaxID=40348 RepID=A0A3P7JPS0_STRVU|nr:unnamed protein product [Strongylus vulgaris]